MKKEYNNDVLFLLNWKDGNELVCTRLKVTRRERVVLADTDNEFDLITAVDDIGRRYTNLPPGLYINKSNIIYTYKLDNWEYEKTKANFLTKEELKKKMDEMNHNLDLLLNGVFHTKYYIEKIKSLYCD